MLSRERAAELRKALTDPRKIVEACGYSGDIVTEGSSIKIRCPWHADDGRPNCSITMRGDSTLSVKCFSCNKGGDILHLIQALLGIEKWGDVVKEAARIAGMPDIVDAPKKAPPVPSGERVYPPNDEVQKVWRQTVDILQDAHLCDQLRARGIVPEMVREYARAIPEVSSKPRWTFVKGPEKALSWHQADYRLIFPMFDDRGELVTLHARRFGVQGDTRKGTSPAGFKVAGSMMMSPAALRLREWTDTIIVEGAPNYLVIAALYPDRPVVGIINGSVKGSAFPRIVRGARVTIWTDNELQLDRATNELKPGAGSKYGEQLVKILIGRRLRLVKLPIPDGQKKAPDANDVFKVGGGAAIEKVLAEAETLSTDANADAAAVWERAAGLAGSDLPFFNVAEADECIAGLDDRDVIRIDGQTPIACCFNEFGEKIGIARPGQSHPGWLADELGQNFLRTGEVGPAGVLVTQGFENFAVLAQHFDADNPNSPAVLAGPPPKTTARITFWPPQPFEDADHYEVRASEPSVAALTGKHAIQSSLDAAQPVQIERPIPPPEDKPAKTFPRTDFGNAERLAYHYGADIKYVFDWREFVVWDGRRWARDRTFEVNRRAITVTRMMYEGNEDDRKWAHESESSGKHAAVVNLVREQAGIAILPERLDADPLLLNVHNGVLDLRTGRLLPHDRRHIMMKLADVHFEPKAKCPKWIKFLNRIFDNNQRLISYIQRAAGYSLTGDVSEHVLFLLYGTGRNGKSTFILTLQSLMGDYSQTTSSEVLMFHGKKLDAGQQSAIATLKGARFVTAGETEEDGILSESVAKQLTKGDIIQAKFMGKDVFEYLPSHKLWMPTNHRPKTRGSDAGLWSMLKPIPFTVTIPVEERDRTLPAQLSVERSGILNWALDGCLEWQKKRLGQPPEIDDAISAYRKAMDTLQPFIDECCEIAPFERVKISALRTAYEMWCKESSKDAVSQKKFGLMLEEKFPAGSDGSARFRSGLKLKAEWRKDVEHSERER
jgi:P4 family phage/plasmid primase-like protien